jgi:hypothetical protein
LESIAGSNSTDRDLIDCGRIRRFGAVLVSLDVIYGSPVPTDFVSSIEQRTTLSQGRLKKDGRLLYSGAIERSGGGFFVLFHSFRTLLPLVPAEWLGPRVEWPARDVRPYSE